MHEAFLTDSPSAALRRGLFLMLLPVLVWFPTLTYDFVLDDAGTFLEDPLAQGPLNIPAIAGNPVHVERSTLPFYRPVITLTYWLDRYVWGVNPAGFHLTNILWHMLSVLLAYALLRQAGMTKELGLMAVALFAVLPSQAEAVAWVQGRVDLVASAFFLAAASAGVRLREEPTLRTWTIALLAFAMALLSKEPAVILPGILVLLWRVRGRESWKTTAVRLIPFLAVLIAYAGVRRAVLSGTPGFALASDQAFSRGLGLAAIVGEYLRIIVWPGLVPNFHVLVFPEGSPTSGTVGITLAILLGVIIAALLGQRSTTVSGSSLLPVRIGMAWFLITLTPVLGVIASRNTPTVGYFVTERYAYLPSLGICLVVAWGLRRLLRRQAWLVSAAALLLLVASGIALARAQAWRDAETMYRAILLRTADRALAHGNLGTLYLERGEVEAAIAEFEAILRDDPTHAMALNNLGVARARQGRSDEALALYREALRMRPAYAEAWNNLGALMEERGELVEARTAYRKALAIDPSLVQARRNLKTLGGTAPGEGGGVP